MTKIKPFRALVYNQDSIKDLSKVICPPYDVISPVKQEYFLNLSPYNFIHVLFNKEISGEDKYQRAGICFREWQKNKVIVFDEKPAVYFYSQQYNSRGEKKERIGFIALLHLNSSIFGHEHTHLGPKEDRLRLIRAVRANLSPIFVLFLDQKRVIQRTYQQCVKEIAPFINVVDDEKVTHKLWRLDSQDILSDMQKRMLGENIFIADGHHRFEVACAYREEMAQKFPGLTEEADFNYTMAYFTNINSPGLTIWPFHRLVNLDYPFDLGKFLASLSAYFNVEEIKEKTRLFFLMEKAGNSEHVLGIYKDKRYWLLRLKNIKILEKIITDKTAEYKTLDVCILNYVILKNVLGVDFTDKDKITFSPHAQEFIDSVNNKPSHIAFFLNPAKTRQLVSLALNNEKMPPKTTYFYPKVLSGLVINKHNEDKI